MEVSSSQHQGLCARQQPGALDAEAAADAADNNQQLNAPYAKWRCTCMLSHATFFSSGSRTSGGKCDTIMKVLQQQSSFALISFASSLI
jgi:hypothetical protein